jgi:hypothetical protein
MRAALVGTWVRCRGIAEGVLGGDGLQLGADKKWTMLVDDGAGTLVAVNDPARRGIFVVQPPISVGLLASNGSEQSLVVLLDGTGRRMNVARSTFDPVDVGYVRR